MFYLHALPSRNCPQRSQCSQSSQGSESCKVWASFNCQTQDRNQDNDEVKTGPDTTEVFVETKGEPFENHLNSEEHSKHQIYDLQNELQLLIVLEIDVFKTEWQTENKNPFMQILYTAILFEFFLNFWVKSVFTWMQKWVEEQSTQRMDYQQYHGWQTGKRTTFREARFRPSRNNNYK